MTSIALSVNISANLKDGNRDRPCDNAGLYRRFNDPIAAELRHDNKSCGWLVAMTILTPAAVLALAASCQSLVAPMTILQQAQVESGLDAGAVHVNADGSRDLGLMQINDRNVAWLDLRNPFDPCQSIRAASDLYASFSRYNTGSPTKGIGYAQKVMAGNPSGGRAKPLLADPPSASVFVHPVARRELISALIARH